MHSMQSSVDRTNSCMAKIRVPLHVCVQKFALAVCGERMFSASTFPQTTSIPGTASIISSEHAVFAPWWWCRPPAAQIPEPSWHVGQDKGADGRHTIRQISTFPWENYQNTGAVVTTYSANVIAAWTWPSACDAAAFLSRPSLLQEN